MKATLKNYRQSPRKVRLVADLVRGKKVNDALTELRFTPKRASAVVAKLIESAKANAVTNESKKEDGLIISRIAVDEGFTLNRMRARARGRGARIRKRTSHITVELAENGKENSNESKS